MRWSVLFVCLAAACNAAPSGVTAMHTLHEPSAPVVVPTLHDDFYLMPFPNDLRIGADGTLDLSRYPRVDQPGSIVANYIDDFDRGITGFGTSSGIYFRFDGDLDASTLPQKTADSLADGASAFVVDVTPGSPTFGKRAPVDVHYEKQAYDFIGPFWVVLQPFPGMPLREKTTYAAILTDGVHGADGRPVRRDGDLDAALQKNAASSSDAKIAAAAHAYAPLVSWLQTQPQLAAHVVDATVFTTLDATGMMAKLRQAVYANVPAPSLTDLAYAGEDQAGVNQLYEAHYPGPNFQQGDPPYQMSGGQMTLDANGLPQVVRMESLRLALSIPEGDMPKNGWPVVIYAHGTGGDYHDFIGDGSAREAAKVTDASGNVIAQLAMVGVDQVLAGTRTPPDTNYDLAFFNPLNVVGARYNPLQGAADDFQLLRLLVSINVAAAPTTGKPIKFDPDRIYFKGHSEGSLTGPLFLSAEPQVKAAILSGAGANLVQSLLSKTMPLNIPDIVQKFFNDPTDRWHPVLNLLQNYLEEADPGNYARLLFREPPSGMMPKSIFQSLGYVDTYAPIPTGKAMALALGLQPVNPKLDDIAGLDLENMQWADAPVVSNVAGGSATGVLLEYQAPAGIDGHFVIFHVPAAIAQSNRFLATHAATGVARLDPP